ncbi:unnamed protein product, partial [Amoebophrya sp. A25]
SRLFGCKLSSICSDFQSNFQYHTFGAQDASGGSAFPLGRNRGIASRGHYQGVAGGGGGNRGFYNISSGAPGGLFGQNKGGRRGASSVTPALETDNFWHSLRQGGASHGSGAAFGTTGGANAVICHASSIRRGGTQRRAAMKI